MTVVVDKDKRVTSNILTKYEYVSIINTRSQQIESKNVRLFIDINSLDKSKIHNPFYIATEEFKQNKIPFMLTRKIGNHKIEYWSLIGDKMVYIED